MLIARQKDERVEITAQTLPEENASTRILRTLNFTRIGAALDDEVGEVWVWMQLRNVG